jgi:UDP-N-acetylmuramoylalanine--D-glutamate ligase
MPFFIPDFLRPLLAGPVAVFGGGRAGQAVLTLLVKMGASGTLFDEKDVKNGIVNNFDWTAARSHRLVIFSPEFPPDHPWLATARAAGAECLGEIDFAALGWRGRVVAITGTNGKTTLTEFLTHALRSVGVDARATGSQGFPFSQLVADTDGGASAEAIAVCEVSSFQAETLRHFRADSTLWINFAEDHLERHAGMEDYFAAKWTLVERTTPGAVFAGESVQRYARKFSRSLSVLSGVFSEVKTPNPALAGTVFAAQPHYENYLLAAAWWKRSGRSEAQLKAAAQSFQLGRHRLARIALIGDVTWWNDSKATNFHAVEAALASFDGPVFVILGGKSRGGDLAGFVRRIAPRIKQAFLLGETKGILATFCRAYRVPHGVCEDLAEAVARAAETARFGDHVLLSPGFASVDLFRDYEECGNEFESLVNNLGATATLR